MRLTKPDFKVASGLEGTLRRLLFELASIGRELVRIPAEIFMRAAELAGAAVLAAWRFAWPYAQAAGGAAMRALLWVERELTPARAALMVAAGTTLVLGASQFAAYRAIAIGVPDYVDVAGVAPAPAVEAEDAGSAHAWVGLPLALLALGIVAWAASGRWRAARLLVAVGAAVVLISLVVDMPKGLDEGNAAVAYEGASAELLGGFWAQLASGIVLIVLGPLLARLLEPRARMAASQGERRYQTPRLRLPSRLRLPAPRRPATLGRAPRATREARS